MVGRENVMKPALGTSQHFYTTRWTLVALAQDDSIPGRQALEDLCTAYYEPVVAFLRCGLGSDDLARDMAHEFFAEILEGRALRHADPATGRFRSYLLGAVKHFASRRREAASRLKRGGGAVALPLEVTEVGAVADERQMEPDAAFDRQWALTVLQKSLGALRTESETEGRRAVFEHAQRFLAGDGGHGDQAAAAAACGLTLGAFRMQLVRLRKRLRHHVKEEIRGTLTDPAQVDQEMAALFAALGS
jgi:RNA polymerase sigma-70 factor (ECF subfamily)